MQANKPAILVVMLFMMCSMGSATAAAQDLPWQITVTPDGGSRVFGLTLGKSTLVDANRVFRLAPDVALFDTPGKPLAVEAYYSNVTLHGLRAKVVVELDLPKALLTSLRDRGLKRTPLEHGGRKIGLSNRDLAMLAEKPIASITYIPTANLEKETVAARFGEPEEKLPVDPETTFWLNPAKGLAIAVNKKGREVLQYVAPRDFDRIRRLLPKR